MLQAPFITNRNAASSHAIGAGHLRQLQAHGLKSTKRADAGHFAACGHSPLEAHACAHATVVTRHDGCAYATVVTVASNWLPSLLAQTYAAVFQRYGPRACML